MAIFRDKLNQMKEFIYLKKAFRFLKHKRTCVKRNKEEVVEITKEEVLIISNIKKKKFNFVTIMNESTQVQIYLYSPSRHKHEDVISPPDKNRNVNKGKKKNHQRNNFKMKDAFIVGDMKHQL